MKSLSKWLTGLACVLAASTLQAATILGPVTAVTGIDGLSFQLSDGQTATYNVTFEAGTYNSVYGATAEGTTAFWGDESNALIAANSIFDTLTANGVYGLIGPINGNAGSL